MTEQTLAPGQADEGDGTPPEPRVIIPTRVLPAADQPPTASTPPKPDFPPFSQQDRTGLATITDAPPAAPRPSAPEPTYDPNPPWWRELAAKTLGTEEQTEAAPVAAEPQSVTATVTVKTTIPRRPSQPPGTPTAKAGGGSGGGWNGRGPGPGAPPEDPPSRHTKCAHCGGEFTACSCPLHGQPPPQAPPAAPADPQPEDEAEEIEQEVTVKVDVSKQKEKPSKYKPPSTRDVLKTTPNKAKTGWHPARVRWTFHWLGPAIPGWGLNVLTKVQHLIVWFHEPGEQFWMSVTFVAGAAWIGWRTRGWYPPLAWICRIPFATTLIAALTVHIPLS
ncbi:hypothetical protein [Kitasatospora sp. NPDC086791]|uniref:hypothetical protein n=1 Tax=Kitasatospora sp. NPDC086791 TaxID=3155178 RepID=UPI003421D78C